MNIHHTILLNSRGYASHARCGQNHSGNHGLVSDSRARGYWQCQGCGTFYTTEQVATPKKGEIGSGGVITQYPYEPN